MSASQVLVELEEYASASKGLLDPSLEAVGLIPVIGALKNVDEVAALVKAFRQGENLLGNLGDGTRAGSRLALAGAGAAENAGTLNRVSESFNAAADTTRAGQRLAEAGEVVKDAAKATGRAAESADKIVDTRPSGVYNGEKGSDLEVREWYVSKVSAISDSLNKDRPLEERAWQAFQMRNNLRTDARELMINTSQRNRLDIEKPNWEFEDLIENKMMRKGLTRQEALEDIIKTATKTNKNVNMKYGIGR